eukprot:1187201-Prorocentrum_minimum.AAC.2
MVLTRRRSETRSSRGGGTKAFFHLRSFGPVSAGRDPRRPQEGRLCAGTSSCVDATPACGRYTRTWTLHPHVDATPTRGRYTRTWTLNPRVDATPARGRETRTWTLNPHVDAKPARGR